MGLLTAYQTLFLATGIVVFALAHRDVKRKHLSPAPEEPAKQGWLDALAAERLRILDGLKQDGLIDQTECEEITRRILSGIPKLARPKSVN